jgi:hypothetical protein
VVVLTAAMAAGMVAAVAAINFLSPACRQTVKSKRG